MYFKVVLENYHIFEIKRMDYLKSNFTAVLLHFIVQIVQGLELHNVSPRTCIIGAGYSGLATAKYLKEYNMTFTVFEASKYLGGVWHFDPRVGVDEDGIPIFSKMYRNLRINTPIQLAEFHDFPFPEGTSSYPSSDCILKYMKSFASKFGILQYIQFRSLVTSLKRLKDQWQLTYWRGDTRDTVSEVCDYVVVATGLNNDPVWPEIQGENIFQGTISHSHNYRGDTDVYRNRRVLVIGGGFSGLDIATQISKVASKLIHSRHNVMNLPVYDETHIKKPDIKSFTHNGAIFDDGSFEEVDDVIYCTGYINWHPFLDDTSGLIRKKNLIMPLYRKIVNIKHPSMLFVGATRNIIQKTYDAQGNYAASLIARRFQLPLEDDMMKSWIDEANNVQNIEDINTVGKQKSWITTDLKLPDENLLYYCGNLSQEAGIPPLPPVYNSMIAFIKINNANDLIHSKEYEWRIIDDFNFDRVYIGPRELKCPID